MPIIPKIIQFNNKIVTQGNSALGWSSNPITYRVYIKENNGGFVQPTQTAGYTDDVVTLYNFAYQNYTFESYSVTGANLTGDKFTILNSDVSAEGIFKYHAPGVSSNLLNDTNVYSGGLSGSFSGGTNRVYYEPFIQIPDGWNYTVLKFKHYGNYVAPTTAFSSIYTRNLSFYFNGPRFSLGTMNSADPDSYQSAMYAGNHKGVWDGPGFTPSTAAKQVSASYYGATSYVTAYTTWARNVAENTTGIYRLVIDNNTNDVSSYWGSTYMGSATFSASVSDFRGCALHQDFRLPYGQTVNYNYKIWDIGLSVFNDFSNATAYY